MYAEERQQAIARLVGERGRVAVVELASEFDVTTETVRRDLSLLERAGLVHRVHGGAVPAGALAGIEAALSERDTVNQRAKEQIARAALAHLPRGEATIVIDAGSTTARLASLLPSDRRLVVVTHAVPVAARLAGLPNVELHLLPGRVRPSTQAAVGADTVAALSRIRADVVFIGTNGLTVGHGLSTPDLEEAAAKRALVRAARRVVVLADSSKIGQEAAQSFADLDAVDVVISDGAIDPRDQAEIAAAGPEVVIA
ncbi:DeoR/GlpR family DNA-binding transcription regulator [Nocardioides jiangxiensis]|uniref:Lactose phosphotransferase system repressor n=1 Tax=Nocardioides jiangxiensis TaxID=3064524 RepID=A0ABT9B352_9ACTN|nr:DeoR/GlpR family DNA-binding transcription regulator [Nocardioides sp. WY-20]MDO7869244.1 DeoR/GlpR family DNA-binding transcription regulator [Nocardioides sp. WY-20]